MAALLEPREEVWGAHKQYWGSSFPANASDCVGVAFGVGDVIWNNGPGNGEPIGWICSAASTSLGNPGTWIPFGTLGGASQNSAVGVASKQVAHVTYNFAVDGGAQSTITLAANTTIPKNAIITNVYFNSTTALAGASATVAFGTSAGSSSSALLAATAITSFTLNALVHGVPTPQTASTFVKMSTAGQVTITIATANLTAGVIEAYIEFVVSPT